jgi:hypothetical protein
MADDVRFPGVVADDFRNCYGAALIGGLVYSHGGDVTDLIKLDAEPNRDCATWMGTLVAPMEVRPKKGYDVLESMKLVPVCRSGRGWLLLGKDGRPMRGLEQEDVVDAEGAMGILSSRQ